MWSTGLGLTFEVDIHVKHVIYAVTLYFGMTFLEESYWARWDTQENRIVSLTDSFVESQKYLILCWKQKQQL